MSGSTSGGGSGTTSSGSGQGTTSSSGGNNDGRGGTDMPSTSAEPTMMLSTGKHVSTTTPHGLKIYETLSLWFILKLTLRAYINLSLPSLINFELKSLNKRCYLPC